MRRMHSGNIRPDNHGNDGSLARRLAWLRRMPIHWKLLLGGQMLFTFYAVRSRQKLVEKRRSELAAGDQGQEHQQM